MAFPNVTSNSFEYCAINERPGWDNNFGNFKFMLPNGY